MFSYIPGLYQPDASKESLTFHVGQPKMSLDTATGLVGTQRPAAENGQSEELMYFILQRLWLFIRPRAPVRGFCSMES